MFTLTQEENDAVILAEDSRRTKLNTLFFSEISLNSFFRRPDWSPDGSILVTPAGQQVQQEVSSVGGSSVTRVYPSCYVFHRKALPAGPFATLRSPLGVPTVVRFNPVTFGERGGGDRPDEERSWLFQPTDQKQFLQYYKQRVSLTSRHGGTILNRTASRKSSPSSFATDENKTSSDMDIAKMRNSRGDNNSNNSFSFSVNNATAPNTANTTTATTRYSGDASIGRGVEDDCEMEAKQPVKEEKKTLVEKLEEDDDVIYVGVIEGDLREDSVSKQTCNKEFEGNNSTRNHNSCNGNNGGSNNENNGARVISSSCTTKAKPNTTDDMEFEIISRPDHSDPCVKNPVLVEEQSSLSVVGSASMKLLPRFIWAIGTYDGSVIIYDTEHFCSPIAQFQNLHLAPITDISWSLDGMTLSIGSSDGYITLIVFSKQELGTPILPAFFFERAAASARRSSASKAAGPTAGGDEGENRNEEQVSTVKQNGGREYKGLKFPLKQVESSMKNVTSESGHVSRKMVPTFVGPLP